MLATGKTLMWLNVFIFAEEFMERLLCYKGSRLSSRTVVQGFEKGILPWILSLARSLDGFAYCLQQQQLYKLPPM